MKVVYNRRRIVHTLRILRSALCNKNANQKFHKDPACTGAGALTAAHELKFVITMASPLRKTSFATDRA